MRTTLDDLLRRRKIVVADGAWGTELSRYGLEPGEPPEIWNLTRPEAVRAVAAAYVAAGADVILTNSFGGSRIKLERAGLAHRTREVNRRAAELSREAAGDHTLVFASVGPTGELLEPLGSLTGDRLIAAFAEQIAALIEGGADGIVIETMSDLREAEAAVKAARSVGRFTTVACMTFNRDRRGYATMMGIRPEQAARALTEAGADLVGANCGSGADAMTGVIAAMRPATHLPLWAKPNAGMPEIVEGRTVFRQTPDEMAKHLDTLREAGARVIGGCCGSTPEHIRRIAEWRFRLLSEAG